MKKFAVTKNGTNVYTHPKAHPHRMDDVAIEAIAQMVIPKVPADENDRAQTRACETFDFGRTIGFNYRTELKPGMRTFKMHRMGSNGELREWESLMTIDGMPTPVSTLTTVCFWDSDNSCWVLWTNHEGEEDPWPEPGSDRFNHLSEEDKAKAAEWHNAHPLICTPAEIEQAKELGLIGKIWYFFVGEYEIPWGLQQPYAEWEEKKGPFYDRNKAEKEMKSWEKKMKGEREFVTGLYNGVEKTWLDEAKMNEHNLEQSIKNLESIIKRFEDKINKEEVELEKIRLLLQ